MTDTLSKVREFHDVYGATVNDSPSVEDESLNELRLNLLQEELGELREALAAGDVVEVLDALTDLQYVLDGAYLAFGLHGLKHVAFREVHRANMSKLGPDGKPILRESDNKVLRGPNYTPPDLDSIVAAFLKDAA